MLILELCRRRKLGVAVIHGHRFTLVRSVESSEAVLIHSIARMVAVVVDKHTCGNTRNFLEHRTHCLVCTLNNNTFIRCAGIVPGDAHVFNRCSVHLDVRRRIQHNLISKLAAARHDKNHERSTDYITPLYHLLISPS